MTAIEHLSSHKYNPGLLPDTDDVQALKVAMQNELQEISRSINTFSDPANPLTADGGLVAKDYGILRHRPVWDDYVTGYLGPSNTGASKPTQATINGTVVQGYKYALNDEAFFNIHIKHDFKKPIGDNDTGYGGVTDFPSFHVHWHDDGTSALSTHDVKFQVDALISKGYGKGDFSSAAVAFTTQQRLFPSGGSHTAWAHHITDDDDMTFSAANAALLEPDSYIQGRIIRIAIDTTGGRVEYPGDIFLLGTDMHYQRDKIGTIERNGDTNNLFTSGGFS